MNKFINRLKNFYVASIKASLTLLLLVSITSASLGQDILMAWEFNGYAGNEALGAATTVFPNISATSPSGEVLRGSGLTASTQQNRFNGRSWGLSDLPTAISGNDYMYFTITPDPGYQITITSIIYNFQRSSQGPTSLTLRSSHDAYASDLDTKTGIANSNDGLTATISTISNVSTALTFRLYGYNAGNATGSGGFEGTGDDIIIYGTVSPIKDADSEINPPATQITGTSISSLATTAGAAVDVFSFEMEDLGTIDGQPTIVTNIRVIPGSLNSADWTDHIQGVTLSDGSPIVTGTPDIQDTYIDIPITSGDLVVADNTSTEVTLAVYLNSSNIVDDATLSFQILASGHGFTADNSGSLFADPLQGGNILSGDFTIDVSATDLRFFQQPTNVLINDVMNPAVTVGFTDVNGNIDTGFETEEVSIAANSLTLSGSSTTIQEVQADGLAYFNDLRFTTPGTGALTASDVNEVISSPGPTVTSSTFDVIPVQSTIQAVAGSEAAIISSIVNDASITSVSEGVQVWQLDLFDGDGINPDNDGLNTDYTSIRIDQHMANEIADWQSAILAVGFFEGSVNIPGIISINQTNISFTPTNPISVPDGGAVGGSKKTISVRISLLTTLPVGIDGSRFVFEVSEGGVTVDGAGSQLGTFTASSSNTANDIDVEGTKLLFVQQPTNVIQNQTMSPDVTVGFSDANDNIDVDFETEEVEISANGVTLTGGPITGEILADGLAYFSTLSFSTFGTGTLTALDVNEVLGTGETLESNSFNVVAVADHLTFVGVPASGQLDQIISTFTVEARRPNESIDTNYSDDITISINSGPGNISGTVIQTAVNGVATFDDIAFDVTGSYTLLAQSTGLTDDVSFNIVIVGADESILPNGLETMNTAISTPSTIAEHEAGNGFINTGVLTFSGGGAANEADIRNTSLSTGYPGASGGANVFFTSIAGEYGFAIEDIDASAYGNLKLQFAVRKENSTGGFADLSVDFWNGDSWEPITITDFPQADGTGWTLLSTVTLPATAEINGLGLRWVKSSDGKACRIDDVSLVGTPKSATNLIVATINSGLPVVSGVSFDVDINVQDNVGAPANVLDDTNIELTLNTGTGTLGGNLTSTILAGTSTAVISGVTYDALVTTSGEAGVIVSVRRTSGDVLASDDSDPFSVLATEPLTSSSALVIGTRTTSSIDFSWTNGDGAERIVVAKEGSAVDQNPVDGTSYSPNADFTLGEDIGNGNIVVFAGTGNAVSVTGLSPDNTAYHFAVFELNGSGALVNYKQLDPTIGNALTTCNDPVTQASALSTNNLTSNSTDLSWTDGDGTGRIVIMNSVNSFTDPVDGDDSYVADPSWNNAGQQVVYFASGAGVPVSVTNLTAATTYYFRVYEFNCTGGDINYKTDIDNTISSQTHLFSQYFTACPPSGWFNVLISGDQNWQCDDINGYASASGLGSSSANEAWYVTPTIDFSVLTNEKMTFNSWTSGTDTDHPRLTVMYSTDYSGSGNPYVANWDTLVYNVPGQNSQSWVNSGSIDLSMIPDGLAYIAFRYASSGTTTGNATEWRIDDVEIFDQSCTAPLTQATNLTFSQVAQDSMTVNWTNGDGIGRLVVVKEGSVVTFTPVDGTEYEANNIFGSGLEIGNPGEGNKVVYSGGSNTFELKGLAPGTIYHFAVYEFSCNQSNRAYLSPALTGSRVTLDPGGSDIIDSLTYTYKELSDYLKYKGFNNLSDSANSKGVFGFTIRDGGSDGTDADALPTTLTSITFSTNGSNAIRAATLFDGSTLLDEQTLNGLTEITFSGLSATAGDGGTKSLELKVTFEDDVIDNEQIIFSVTSAIADPSGSQFFQPDAGAAQSSSTVNHNTIRVDADTLIFVQRPYFSVPINEAFVVEVEATDSLGARDLDKSLTISKIAGIGDLTSDSGLTIPQPLDSTALWTDLIYNTEENTEFQVSDGGSLTISTGSLKAKPRYSIFTFTGANGDEISFSPDFQPFEVIVSDVTRGTGITPAISTNAFSSSSWPAAQDTASYYQITLIANTGYTFDVSSIEFDHRRSGSGPTNWELQNSVNLSTQGGPILGDSDWEVNRNTEALLSISGEDTVTFKLFAYGATHGNGTWAIDNLEIFGQANDIQAPSFTLGFPQYDSVAIDGFDLLINVDEAATAYYIVQDPSISAPSRAEVEAGLDGDGGAPLFFGSTVVSQADSTFIARVRAPGLPALSDVYFVLNDGLYQSDTTALLADLPISDTDTDFSIVPLPVGLVLPSTADNSGDSVAVLSFNIDDAGTRDGSPTHVTKLSFAQNGNSTIDYQGIIAGARLYNDTEGSSIPISNTTIGLSSIDVDVPLGALTVDDGTTEQVTLFVWLSSTVPDQESLDFAIGGAGNTSETYSIGSQFNDPLTSVASNTFTIEVDATRLNITSHTMSIPTKNRDLNLNVESVDENGNLDVNETSDVTVILGQFSQIGGGISADPDPPGLTKALIAGEISWDNIRYSQNTDFINLITASTTLTDDTTALIEIGSPFDLIVSSGLTLNQNLQVSNVDIQSTGNLTISSGVVLTVEGDFNVDGVLNGQSGTVDFNATGNTLQLITGTDTADFYNLTISNNGTMGVRSEIDINLHNTIKLNTGVIFDADGASDDKNFTLISTPSYTARIAAIEDGATLNGNVVWQRSLRTGPQGWRYVGTPIKGQTVAEWIDDVYIQGITGYPNWWRNSNFGYYNEPTGTTGQNGYDGWVDYKQDTDPIPVGVGSKLWEWDQFYSPTLTIVNSGPPTIGDGADNIVNTGEAITFPVSFTNGSLDGGGWNFYANPYPCELDWNSADFVHTNIEGGAVYIWNPDVLQYGTYDGSESINGVTQYIASGQGFFIKAIDGTAVVSVSENAKSTADGNSFLRIADEPYASLKLKISSDKNHVDETVVKFKNNTADEYNPIYDARKLAGGWINLSSKSSDSDQLLAINSMGSPRGVQSLAIDISPYYYGGYSFSFPKIDGFEDGTQLILKDNYLDKSTMIENDSKYSFNIVENDVNSFGSDRFEVQLLTPLDFSFENVEAKAGQEFVVPVHADNVQDILSAKMKIVWDEVAISFVGVEEVSDFSEFDLSEVESGILKFAKTSSTSMEMPDGTILFALRFVAQNGYPKTDLQFESSSMSFKAIGDIDMPFNTYDIQLNILQNMLIEGKVSTFSGAPITGVNVMATGDETIENNSDEVGDFWLEAHEQSLYSLSATKEDDVSLSRTTTTVDIIMAVRHMLQIDEFDNPYQSIAADVNGSHSITALDLSIMRKVVLGMQKDFNNDLRWLFIPESLDLSSNPFDYETNLDVDLASENVNVNFKGVRIGDINDSWRLLSNARRSSGSINLSMEHVKSDGQFIEVPIVVKDFENISGYQFSIRWDAQKLEYIDIVNALLKGNFNESLAHQGLIATLWDENSGNSNTLDDGMTLFTLRFKARQDDAETKIEISSALTEAMAFDNDLNSLSINSTPANINVAELRNGKLELMQNMPNPFEYNTDIEFKIPKAGLAKLSVINTLGEVIYLHQKEYRAGFYKVSWNKSQSDMNITPGVYLYKLECGGQQIVKKMVIR